MRSRHQGRKTVDPIGRADSNTTVGNWRFLRTGRWVTVLPFTLEDSNSTKLRCGWQRSCSAEYMRQNNLVILSSSSASVVFCSK